VRIQSSIAPVCGVVALLAARVAQGDALLLTPGIGAPSEVSNAERVVAVGPQYRYEDGVVTRFPASWCRLESVSDDGDVMAGAFCIDGHSVAFRWDWSTGEVVDLSATIGDAVATDVSADGSVVVGRAIAFNVNQAFRWTEETGVVLLGDLPSGGVHSEATGVSADGRVVVGAGEVYGGTTLHRAFRWEDGVMESLGVLPGTNDAQSEADAVSADGSVVIGQSAGGYEAGDPFRWSADTGMQPLGHLPGGRTEGRAHDVSGDGRIVVGSAGDAFVWDPAFGMRSLRNVLENEFDLDTSAFDTLGYASAISTDGRVIGGRGERPDRRSEGWIAVLPHPPGLFGCNVELDGDGAYGDGETVRITTLRYANLGPTPLGTRLRLELAMPIPLTLQLIDLGADGSFALPSGLNVDLAPIAMFTVQPGQPRGPFTLRCSLEDAVTGRVQAEDWVPFRLE